MTRQIWKAAMLGLITLLQFAVTGEASALTKPTLLSPGDNAQITSPSVTFSWSHPYSDLYEVKIKTNGGTLKYRSGKLSSKSKTIDLSSIGLTFGSTYKWYVVVYANGQEDSSSDRYFTYKVEGYCSVSSGLSVSPNPVVLDQNFSVNFSLKEIRGSPKTFESIAVAIVRADGSNVFDAGMFNGVQVPANGVWSQSVTSRIFADKGPGTYKAVLRGKLPGGNWFDFDTVSGGINPKQFNVTAALPGAAAVSPTSGSWTSSPQNVSVVSSGANTIYYTMVNTYDGSTPSDPPVPTPSSNNGSYAGPSTAFSLYASPGENKKIKVRFVGCNSTGCGPPSGSLSYTLNLQSGAVPGGVSVNPSSGSWTSSPQNVAVSSPNATAIYYTIRTTLNGTAPADPPEPTASLKDGMISGAAGGFQVFANPGQNKILKVRFRGYNSSGYGPTTGSFLYQIVADDHGNDISSATPIALNGSKGGRIDYLYDRDCFGVEVTQSGTLTVSTTGSTDTYGYLLDQNSREVHSGHDDNSGPGSNFLISRYVEPGRYFACVRHYSIHGTGSYKLVTSFSIGSSGMRRAVLLLHGMNSGPDKWNELIKYRWDGQCEDLPSTKRTKAQGKQDKSGAVCYRLQFGTYDQRYGATGLEAARCRAVGGCSGDFTRIYNPSGRDLGAEVLLAVSKIQSQLTAEREVVLVGHSRGGLAARSFLQRPNDAEVDSIRSAVVGLVTTGTPHQGSPLGRVYDYLKIYCLDRQGRRITSSNQAGTEKDQWQACEDDWEAVDFLAESEVVRVFAENTDLRRPAVGFLNPDSPDIKNLREPNSLARLPRDVSVVQLVYSGRDLGQLSPAYSVWDHLGPQAGPQFSDRSRNFVLCQNVGACDKNEDYPEFDGDGVVPSSSQVIPGFSGEIIKKTGLFHTDEPEAAEDIAEALDRIEAWNESTQ